jgi:outer membrane lipoprotein SlyB
MASVKRILLAIVLGAAIWAALAAPMTNDDVIRMVRGGLGDATVMQAIDAAEPAFDASPEGLVRLKREGVSEAVIQRILARKGAVSGPPAQCRECGTVESVREVSKPGPASGVGAVAGGVVGGAVGRQLGGERNRTAGTVLGAVGGAVAGHQVERHVRGVRSWEIVVRFDDGLTQTVLQATPPAWRAGDRVRVVNGALAAP